MKKKISVLEKRNTVLKENNFLKQDSSRIWLTCDHTLSLYICNLLSGGGHNTFLSQITCKNARIWTFFDWIGNNTDDFRCSDWPKCRYPLVVVDFKSAFLLAYK